MKAKALFNLVILSLMPVFLGGCVAVVAAGGAAGGVAYIKGELRVTLDEPVTAVNNAVEAAGEDLELNRISGNRDLMGGKFIFRNAQDEKITITTTAETDETTKLEIRVGLFGDEQKSQLILDRIRGKL
jgi:uncharacterized membrane protein